MLDQAFCAQLEYCLTTTFRNSSDGKIKDYWCDGILLPNTDKEVLQKTVNNKRELIMTAFIGKTGQERYQLILKFGDKSLSKYFRNLGIQDCIPDASEKNWYSIDISKKVLTIQLL